MRVSFHSYRRSQNGSLLYDPIVEDSVARKLAFRTHGKVFFRAPTGYRDAFVGKTLYPHSASIHPGEEMNISELTGKPEELLAD